MIRPDDLRAIESKEFGFDLGVSGSRQLFRNNLFSHPAVVSIINSTRDSSQAQEMLAARLVMLANLDEDPRYQHASDVAIAAYLRILDLIAPDLAVSLAPLVARLPNIWWARPLATELLGGERAKATMSNHTDERAVFGSVVRLSPHIQSTNSNIHTEYPAVSGPPWRLHISISVRSDRSVAPHVIRNHSDCPNVDYHSYGSGVAT